MALCLNNRISPFLTSSHCLETNGPARAVTIETGDCWKGGSPKGGAPPMPQVFECQLSSPRIAGRLLYQVIEGFLFRRGCLI